MCLSRNAPATWILGKFMTHSMNEEAGSVNEYFLPIVVLAKVRWSVQGWKASPFPGFMLMSTVSVHSGLHLLSPGNTPIWHLNSGSNTVA